MRWVVQGLKRESDRGWRRVVDGGVERTGDLS